ncbi:MAG: thioredoxin family protein [Armatimonadetes bacterium]|nr:thioredoxin family protein [Armatimonadota bacterium]
MKIGDTAPSFALPGVDGATHRLEDLAAAAALVVVQMCNHCPYVIGYQERMNALAREFGPQGVQFVGINSNDAARYPSDSLDNMVIRAREVALPFPYLYDEDQALAKALGAERTPEFFLFDGERKLVYHGRLDDNLEDPEQVEQAYLAEAIEAVLAGHLPAVAETPAVGCSVKWR